MRCQDFREQFRRKNLLQSTMKEGSGVDGEKAVKDRKTQERMLVNGRNDSQGNVGRVGESRKQSGSVETEDQNRTLKIRVPKDDLLSQWRQKRRTRTSRNSSSDSEKKSSAIDMGLFDTCKQMRPTLAVSSESLKRKFKDMANEQREKRIQSISEKSERLCDQQNGVSGRTSPAKQQMSAEEVEWPRILVSLSRKEKEDDFFLIKGCKLPLRPKKRPRAVEKALQNCYPGFWLSDLARGRYDVKERRCSKKKPRGLKAMENQDSDSD